MKPRCAVCGVLTRAAELRTSSKGHRYVLANVRVEALGKRSTGEPVALFVRCMLFGEQATAELAAELRAGADCYCEGTLELGIYVDKLGDPWPSATVWASELRPLGVFEAPESSTTRTRTATNEAHPADGMMPGEQVMSRSGRALGIGGGATGATAGFSDDDVPY
jgi:single-stranded DNA-binding protein